MRDRLTAIFSVIILGFAPVFVERLFPEAGDISLYARDCQVAILAALAFHITPKNQVKARTILLVFFCYLGVEAHQWFFLETHYVLLYSVFMALCAAFFLFNFKKNYLTESDEIIDERLIYLCFFKPRTTLGYFGSLLGSPHAGVSIYTKGLLWGFRYGKPGFTYHAIDEANLRKSYTIHNTHVKGSNEFLEALKSLIGSPAGFLRIRCISTIKPVLAMLGLNYYPKWFQCIPALYAPKVLG